MCFDNPAVSLASSVLRQLRRDRFGFLMRAGTLGASPRRSARCLHPKTGGALCLGSAKVAGQLSARQVLGPLNFAPLLKKSQ